MPIFDLSTLGEPDNLLTFNLFTASPLYRMVRRAPTKREVVEFDLKLPDVLGDADFQTLMGKTYLILDGTMYPNNSTEFDKGRRVLRKVASLVKEQSDPASDLGYVPYKWTEYDGQKQLFVKVLYVDMQEATRQGLVQPFRILCKIKYPVIFSVDMVTALVGGPNASTSGGIGYPFDYPVAYGATTYSQNGTIHNSGDVETYPLSIVINGPINSPRMSNTTTGDFVQLNMNLLTNQDTAIITYDQDTLSITQGGNSILNTLTADSTLFKLPVGDSNLTLTGGTVGTGAFATLTALSAWPLS